MKLENLDQLIIRTGNKKVKEYINKEIETLKLGAK